MVSSCPGSAAALWLQEVSIQVVTPPVAGTTYEFPETTVGWARSVSADVSDAGELGASWPIVTAPKAVGENAPNNPITPIANRTLRMPTSSRSRALTKIRPYFECVRSVNRAPTDQR